MTRSRWYARFVTEWRESVPLPFGPLTRVHALYLESRWQMHCADMAAWDDQLERFARNCTGLLGVLDVESDQGPIGETKS